VRFQIFKNGQAVREFGLHGAYLFGTDGIAIRRAEIRFNDGFIEVDKPNLETAGVALLWDIDGFGRVLLPTTCLPERQLPYNLNLELARARLMQIINKCEDWSFFEPVEGLAEKIDKAQELFIAAVQNIADAPTASRIADESLKKAMEFSEALASRYAKAAFGARGKGHGFGRGCLGCCVDAKHITDPKYLEAMFSIFGLVVVPVNWSRIEIERGTYDFSKVDACITTLGKRKVTVGAGPLLCFSREYLPKWLLEDGPSFEKIRESAYQFVSAAAARYSGMVKSWYVISGLNALNHFGFGFEQVLEITRAANMAVKAAADRAMRIIEIADPWGEYYAFRPDTIPPLVYMDMIIQSGISFDAFGLQMRFGKDQPGMHIRDMMQISAVLDQFALIAKPMYITGVEVPSRNGSGACAPKVAGIWHEEWDELHQAQWVEQFYRIALSKPFVDAVVYSALADGDDSAIAGSGLLTSQTEPKKSYQALKKLYDSIFIR
jgi:hypothetical protein